MKPYETWTDIEKINETIKALCAIASDLDFVLNEKHYADFVIAFEALETNKYIMTLNFPTDDTVRCIAIKKVKRS
ncbi:hypothetical protein BCPG3_114 [Bacillus phage BCPG3]|uniref:Uncharacterized protein n=2 Tax=Wphvirus TaxID=1922327 RepID=W5QUJ2_9CAUD|nr:hypothetical protein BPS13_0122 [Bacillus phage BPS13]YP_009003007.1 hypothetical protein BPS10C_121 [Bacillus phage BPS10C]QQO38880.1 hypothetical protein BCPG1_149 [Bacillus phage BCPG1]QSJ04431.1 hypothetical protein BCPG3_114 [Bacillus phage BCPG3]QSJ04641.1 hypothetical protein BCP18_109 [Bacillus phage BCP18]AEZ50301.1 hypothetical protein BPS13_0122 [Bacillus phage BPS13]AGI12118.1 hypothetical protein BPS10C_121 [Bacillus phage BPS10C]